MARGRVVQVFNSQFAKASDWPQSACSFAYGCCRDVVGPEDASTSGMLTASSLEWGFDLFGHSRIASLMLKTW